MTETESTGIRHCRACGRELIDYRVAEEGDPRMDCGGNCAACQREYERGMCDEDWAEYDAAAGNFPANLGRSPQWRPLLRLRFRAYRYMRRNVQFPRLLSLRIALFVPSIREGDGFEPPEDRCE